MAHINGNIGDKMDETQINNNNQEGDAPNVKRRATQLRSKVWDHFTRYTDKVDNKLRAKCNYNCGTKYLCGSNGYGTKNLITHLSKCNNYLQQINGGQTKIAFQRGEENKMVAWKFDQKDSRNACAYMIIVDELPFSFVENKGFRFFSSVTCPGFKVPCRSTITKDCYQVFVDEKKKLKESLKRNIGRICLTTDSWTCTQQINYMTLTGHYIDNDWKLKKKVLSFCVLGSHKGVEIGKEIENCLRDWEIENVMTFSVDNATSNDKAIDFLKFFFESSNNSLLKGEWIHVRCVAHILNLVVQDGIKKGCKAVDNIRFAVKWIRNSPLRIANFNKYAEYVKCESKKHLVLDCPTRWNSTYDMLQIAILYENVFDRYDLEDAEFGKEIRKADLEVPTWGDWEICKKLCVFLKHFYDVTLKLSGTLYVTSSTVMDDISTIRGLLIDTMNDPLCSDLFQIASFMKIKFDKYFGEIEKMNLLFYYSLVLDPRNKRKYLHFILEDHYQEKKLTKKEIEKKTQYVIDRMGLLYAEYMRIHSPSISTPSCSSSSILGKRSNSDESMPKPLTRNPLREKMKTHIVETTNELTKYLDESVEPESTTFAILAWWKVNSPRFPILSFMARDLLAIPVTTVASEAVFSTSGRILNPFRSSLTPKIVEALICTQDWLRTCTNPGVEEDMDNLQKLIKEWGEVGTSNGE